MASNNNNNLLETITVLIINFNANTLPRAIAFQVFLSITNNFKMDLFDS